MMVFTNRHHLRDKEAKVLIQEIRSSIGLPESLVPEKRKIEVATLEDGAQLVLINNKPAYLKNKNEVIPTLVNTEVLEVIPTIIVDSGAVPHICNGSDLMAPGIVKISGDFKAQTITAIAEQTYGKKIALARALIDAETMRATKRGKVAINVHYIGDKAWNTYKSLI
ncbi:MAG: DUF1947 domain-containing protein [Candidatus Bathyarchaeia archaeon]